MTVGDRIKRAMRDTTPRPKVAQLAAAAGISPSTLYELMRGEMKSSTKLHRIATELGVRAEWLESGDPPMRTLTNDLDAGPVIRGTVPLLSWVQAGPYTAAEDPPDLSACEQISTTARVGPHTFALRVANVSMEPEFPPGTIIIVEPDLDPRPGDYVIVANGAAEATFKQLVQDGGDWLLRPLNPQFPARKMPEHGRIIGVVVASERRYR